MPLDQAPHGYRDDPQVPAFDDAKPIAFMDGDCVLCTWGARMIARFDRSGEIRICPVQTPLGTAVMGHYGMAPDDPESWLFLEDGIAWKGMEAIIRVAERCGGPGRLISVMRVFPRGVRAWIYRRIARNRFALIGKRDQCMIPVPSLRARLME
ncbi:MAG: DCC1-like thiol-disulfide oxidoreductase family protein [Pseudomonadota bacterium]